MISANERLRIFQNVSARVGMDNPMLISEFNKALSQLNKMQTMADMNAMQTIAPPMAQPQPDMMQSNAVSEPLGSGGMSTPPPEQMMA